MTKQLALAAVVIVSACSAATPPAAPAPARLSSSLSPDQAAQRAAQELTMEGFTVLRSRENAETLAATLTKQGEGDRGPFIACRSADGAVDSTAGVTRLTVRMTAWKAEPGSAIYLGSSTTSVTDAGRSSGQRDADCASTGAIEKRLAMALATP